MVFLLYMRQNRAMTHKQKVMVFIARSKGKSYEWLARRNAANKNHGGDRWYMVTGNIEANETPKTAALREVTEETGIKDVQRIVELPIVNKYYSDNQPNVEFIERAYLYIADHPGQVKLNEESTNYQWLSLDDFVDKIWWPKDKLELNKVLKEAV